MASAWQIQAITTSLEGSSVERTLSQLGSGTLNEEFWAKVKLAAGADEVALALGLLTSVKVLVVIGDTGIWYRKTSGALVEKHYAEPINVETSDAGLTVTTLYLGNDSAAEVDVTVIAYE